MWSLVILAFWWMPQSSDAANTDSPFMNDLIRFARQLVNDNNDLQAMVKRMGKKTMEAK